MLLSWFSELTLGRKKKRKTPLKGLKTVPGKGSREQNIKLSGILQQAGASKVTLRQND